MRKLWPITSASLTQDAFTQSIVMGANIQFNSVTINPQNALSGDIDTGRVFLRGLLSLSVARSRRRLVHEAR